MLVKHSVAHCSKFQGTEHGYNDVWPCASCQSFLQDFWQLAQGALLQESSVSAGNFCMHDSQHPIIAGAAMGELSFVSSETSWAVTG